MKRAAFPSGEAAIGSLPVKYGGIVSGLSVPMEPEGWALFACGSAPRNAVNEA